VETPAIREKLAALGCADAQGWYFGRAVAGHVASMQFAPKVDLPTAESPLADRNRAGSGKKW